MMVMPSKEEIKMYETLVPWFVYDENSDVPTLKDGAPKNVQDMYKVYIQKYASKF